MATFDRARFDFNPLPRKEGDISETKSKRLHRISIHSLVKRETIYINPKDSEAIFQSTPS